MFLALDGVWDAMSGEALAGFVASHLCLGLAPEHLCAQLLNMCLCKVLGAGLGITERMNLRYLGRRDFNGRASVELEGRVGLH